MTRYRKRYLTVSDFSSYCKQLNLELRSLSLSSSNAELEMYEKDEIFFPVARLIKPDEYMIKRFELDQEPETYGENIPEWHELERLIYHRPVLDNNNNSELWHPFDWESEQKNRFLFRPEEQQFKPWKEYRVKVKPESENGLFRKTAEHYYHYFQAHQVYAIQKRYPVYAKHNWLIENVNENLSDRAKYLVPLKGNPSISLEGHTNSFDALSFYITLYDNEQDRTFENIPEQDGVKTLDNQQFAHYTSNLKAHAKFVFDKYELSEDKLYEFLFYLLKLHSEYKRSDNLKLANELSTDIQYLTSFVQNVVDLSMYEIEKEIDQRSNSYWTREFRHIDKAIKVYDYAKDTFERLLADYNTKFSTLNISSAEIEDLLDFIEKQGLFIIPYAIFDIDEALNDSRAFSTTSLYIGLSNLTTGFECYLREIANLANQSSIPPNPSIIVKTLEPIIRTMFSWGRSFQQAHSLRKPMYKNDAFGYLADVFTDPNLDEAVKTFLITYRSRNFIAHNYTLENELYYTWYSIVYSAICHSLFYSWKHASIKGWV